MSVIREVGEGIAWNTIGVAMDKVLIFLNVFIILRSLSVYEYGLTELTLSVFSMGSILYLPGIVSTIIADMAVERARSNFGRMKAIFWGYLRIALFFSVVGWATLFFGSTLLAHYTGNDLIDSYIKIISFLFFIAPLRIVSTALPTVMVRFADQALYSIIEEFAKCMLLVLFFLMLGFGANGLLYAVVLSQLAAVVVFIPRTISAYRLLGPTPMEHPESLWKLLTGHRKWSLAASGVSSINQNFYIWIVKVFLGTSAVGIYSAATGLVANLVGLLPMGPVLTSLIPRYVDDRPQLARILKSSIKLQFAVACGLMICGYLFGPVFVVIFPKYRDALPLFYLLLLSLPPNALINAFTPVFAVYKEQQSILNSALFKLVASALLAPISFVLFGIYGIAIENILKTLISLVERFWRLRRFLPEMTLNPRELFIPDQLEYNLGRLVTDRIIVSFRTFFRLRAGRFEETATDRILPP